MYKDLKFIFSFFLLFVGSIFCRSQNATPPQAATWTLQQCIDYALKNNLQIKQNELNEEVTQATLLANKGKMLPNLNGNASHSYNWGKSINPYTNQFDNSEVQTDNFSLSSSITLFSGFQNYNSVKQSQYDLLSSKYDVQKQKNDISLNIASDYLQILMNEELLQQSNDQLSLISAQVKRTKILVDVGNLPKGNLLDIQAQEASEELSVTDAQNQLDISYLTLTQLLDLDSVGGFQIVKPELSIPAETILTSTPDQIYTKALSSQPDIESAEMKLKSSETAVSIAKGGISPRLILSGSIGSGYSNVANNVTGVNLTGYQPIGVTTTGVEVLGPTYQEITNIAPFSNQFNDNVNKAIALQLTFPFFNGFQTKTTIEKAKIQQLNNQYALEITQNQFRKTIQQAFADAKAALKKYYSTLKNVTSLQEAFDYTQTKFNVGMVNSVDYDTSKNNLIKAKSNLLQAKYDYIFKTKVLDFYEGKPLVF